MAGNLHSSSWYRVATLRPRVRDHARFHRHRYRGETWYVLHDASSGRTHRLTPAAYHLVGLLDGQRTTQQVWDATLAMLGDEAPTQDETIRVLGQLHFADALACEVTPDTEELFRRRQRKQTAEGLQRFGNPLAIRVPLLDPSPFLERWMPVVRPLFSRAAGFAFAAVVLAAAVLASVHWAELSADASRQLLEPRNLVLMAVLYPFMKVVHELGHGFAVRSQGGEVHEMGILFLVFVPLPYVDASASAAFADKRQRALVAAAGVIVELGLAALALFLWLATEPGWLHTLAYDVVWIGAASSLLFNGNPLLRFDGYYVLSDWIEIPNLASRSTQYLGMLVQRHLFGLRSARNPVRAPGEPAWFVGYGVASYLYRMAVLIGIAFFLAERFPVVGAGLAIFCVGMQVVVPLARHVRFLLTAPWITAQRPRALAASGLLAAVAGLALFVLPWPSYTRAEGVVWPPEDAQVRAGADGFVVRWLARPGAQVEPGTALLLTRDAGLEAEVAVIEARLAELLARRHAEIGNAAVRGRIVDEEVTSLRSELARARERLGEVVVRSTASGRFVVPRAADLLGRFVRQGELIGYVVGPGVETARVVIPQPSSARVREETVGVALRRVTDPGRVLASAIRREVPGSTDRLPHRALGAPAGGPFPVDPLDEEGLRTLDPVFQLDVALPHSAEAWEIGSRVHVRFDHGAEPLARQLARVVRATFLRRLGV